jgi:pyruvate dehydrogenase E2 component (dihydrolipoamide acetyltransferase)
VLETTALIPQFTIWRAFDLTRLAVARKASLKGVSWNTILLRAYALTLREYPSLNGSWGGDGVRTNPHIGVALAIDTPAGLLAPVLREPHTLGIKALDAAIKQLAGTVKAGKADPSSMGGGTGTVSNLGSFGVQRFNALLTPPQATALSLGTVEVQPVIEFDGAIRARTVCEAGLTVDHRVADGADAARAFATMQEILDDPFLLLG